MKKYIKLAAGEYTQAGDQFLHTNGGEWKDMEVDYRVTDRDEGYVRRPVPYSGKTAFLVNYSPMIRVVIDTTGLSDEEIDNKLAEAAKAEFCYNHGQQMNDFHDNIDWEQTKEDKDVPFIEPQSIPTLKNIQAEGRATRPPYEGCPPSIKYIEI